VKNSITGTDTVTKLISGLKTRIC